ncbi:MAG: hypothetical protein IJ568_05525 [Bacilli bacterium]|nr:hypothetical protein [Bacilli bacterium]
MNILEKIKQIVRLLHENEESIEILKNKLSDSDRKIDYWLHYIELENVPITQSYKIIKEIKRLRQERRSCKNELSLMRVFKDNEQKLCNDQNRDILLNVVCKTNRKQEEAVYSYDAYSQEEINQILGNKGGIE